MRNSGLLSDAPLTRVDQDRFDRGGFVAALADIVRRTSSNQESNVLALVGAWGSGKTSIKNLLVAQLEPDVKGVPDLKGVRAMEFRPWQISETGNITSLFFEALIAHISEEEAMKDSPEQRGKIRLYASLLTKASKIFGFAGKTAGDFIPAGDSSSDSIKLSLQSASIAATAGANFLEGLAGKAPTDLGTLKKEIDSTLRKLTRPILVIIDDMDRLLPEEIFEIVRLVKANADFPNLSYLLLFDREAVEFSIEKSYGRHARAFLEKIIQGSFHVPDLTLEEIAKEFDEGLEALLGKEEVAKIDPERASQLFFEGLCWYLKTPRHIKRLFTSTTFYLSQLASYSGPEVDILDLLGLETLRLFEPDVYEELPICRDRLAGSNKPLLPIKTLEEQEKKAREDAAKQILNRVPEPRRQDAQKLLSIIFPPLFGSQLDKSRALRELRACQVENFDRYFSFRLNKTQVSELELAELFRRAKSGDDLSEWFQKVAERRALEDLLTRLGIRREECDSQIFVPLSRALINLADLVRPDRRFLLPDTTQRIANIILDIATRLANKPENGSQGLFDLLSWVFKSTSGLVVPAQVSERLHHLREKEEPYISGLISTEQSKELLNAVVDRVREATERGALFAHLHCTYLFYVWYRRGDRAALRNWISTTLDSQASVVPLLKVLSKEAESPDPELPKCVRSFDLRLVGECVDPQVLSTKVEQALPTALEEDRQLLQIYLIKLRRWLSNNPEVQR